jgi:hypothetical protein
MNYLRNRFILTAALILISRVSFAQRYGIGQGEGMRGLKIFGAVIFGVVLIIVWLYIRQRIRNRKA